jgi:hypothetical protein
VGKRWVQGILLARPRGTTWSNAADPLNGVHREREKREGTREGLGLRNRVQEGLGVSPLVQGSHGEER